MKEARQSGFTLIEVVVVIAVLALLAGLALPMIGSTTNDARVTKVRAGIDQLTKACQRYKNDTRSYAVERSDARGAANHQLSIKQSTSGWKGPYIDHVISEADNPFGSWIRVYNKLNAAPAGFDLDGNNRADVSGDGNVLVVAGVDEESAEQIDEGLDKGLSGNWKRTGRVQWRADRLYVLLYAE